MSAGHKHSRPNHRHYTEVKNLLAQGSAPQLMQRFRGLDDQHDCTYLAGYNVAGTKRFIDQDVMKALLDPAHATELLGAPIDTGMSPEDTIECLMLHEGVEKVLLDADNDLDTYMACHELATAAEHEEVRRRGGKPIQYERGLKAAIAFCAKKVPGKVDPDFDCTPLLDHPDAVDRKVLAALQKLGISDASKVAKDGVAYGKSTGEDQCAGCAHWQASPDTGPDLSRCDTVCGLVRRDRWCRRYEAKESADGEGDGVPGGDRRGSEEPEDQESGGGGGDDEPSRKPGGEAGQSEPQEGEVSAGPDFAAYGTAAPGNG